MKLLPGSVVVLEGLDATGKSTQMDALQPLFPDDLFIHSPSGSTPLTQGIYELTEESTDLLPLSRQFLHLAAHAELYEREIIPALKYHGVFMDRNWWSTVAYGFFATELMQRADLDVTSFMQLARLPTHGVSPSIVFLFLSPAVKDRHNTPALLAGYRWLQDHIRGLRVVPVPLLPPANTTALIVSWLKSTDLAVG